MDIQEVLAAAKKAKSSGASRFCMGAAWRAPTDRQINHVCDMIKGIKALSLEACVTLGLLKEGQAEKLKEAGLDYYNHNLDTSAEYYKKIITTRSFQDRLDTLQKVSDAGIGVCCGGIIGMGESTEDRLSFLCSLANLNPVPGSVTINQLIKVPGTPLQDAPLVDPFDFVRVIAMSRIMIPESWVRLSAGRQQMSDELQALCFLAGANSLFYGDKLLTEDNAKPIDDDALLHRLGLMKKQQAFD
jgi:biotin synthase